MELTQLPFWCYKVEQSKTINKTEQCSVRECQANPAISAEARDLISNARRSGAYGYVWTV